MIVQLKGNVKFPITLDPTVWIFDDRKIKLEEAFLEDRENDDPYLDKERQQKVRPPVNRSVTRFEGKKVLEHSYVIPIQPFLKTSEPDSNGKTAVLHTKKGDVEITLEQLWESLLMFSKDGKPLRDHGPVKLLFGDGSNQENPIEGIESISVK